MKYSNALNSITSIYFQQKYFVEIAHPCSPHFFRL